MHKLKLKRNLTKLHNTDFNNIFTNGKFKSINEYIGVKYINNNYDNFRFAIIVRKKICKKAVKRNYIKRIIRECIRLNQYLIPKYDYIFIIKKNFPSNNENLIQIKNELKKFLINTLVNKQ